MELTNLTVMRELMGKHGMQFSKALGQNFLVNPSVCPRIAEMGGAAEDTCVLEIGPGIGTLTQELGRRAKKVVAIELDDRLIPILSETMAGFNNVKVVHADAMKIDLRKLVREEFANEKIVACANLPYYITSPLIMRLLEENLPLESITVLVQKEAAQRICAPLPSRDAGAITAAVAWRAEPSLLFHVSRGSFYPAPKVDSSVLKLVLRKGPPYAVSSEPALFQVIRAAFSQRRKMIPNSLSNHLGIEKSKACLVLEDAGIPANSRAEQLGLADFASLANSFVEHGIL